MGWVVAKGPSTPGGSPPEEGRGSGGRQPTRGGGLLKGLLKALYMAAEDPLTLGTLVLPLGGEFWTRPMPWAVRRN